MILYVYGGVAPRVGAWIETCEVIFDIEAKLPVAPRVGAWIETSNMDFTTSPCMTSHPVWVRGLKQEEMAKCVDAYMSHPVWVRGLKQ